jgi:hypothetical protein
VAYGLEAYDIESVRRSELVGEHLKLVSLRGWRDDYSAELSGGQQRRVELARGLAPEPDVLVLAVGEQEITLSGLRSDRPVETPVTCHVRPEALTLRPQGGTGEASTLNGEVTRRGYRAPVRRDGPAVDRQRTRRRTTGSTAGSREQAGNRAPGSEADAVRGGHRLDRVAAAACPSHHTPDRGCD